MIPLELDFIWLPLIAIYAVGWVLFAILISRSGNRSLFALVMAFFTVSILFIAYIGISSYATTSEITVCKLSNSDDTLTILDTNGMIYTAGSNAVLKESIRVNPGDSIRIVIGHYPISDNQILKIERISTTPTICNNLSRC